MLSKISSKNQITLPKKLLSKLGIGAGAERYVTIQLEGDHFTLRPVRFHVQGISDSSSRGQTGLGQYKRLREECAPLLQASEDIFLKKREASLLEFQNRLRRLNRS